jgi:hypothetical protein
MVVCDNESYMPSRDREIHGIRFSQVSSEVEAAEALEKMSHEVIVCFIHLNMSQKASSCMI